MLMEKSSHTLLSEKAVSQLASSFAGPLIGPESPAYAEARAVWNGMIDRYPALIAQPISVSDVVAAVNFARENNLLLAVRGGGHNVAGHGTVDDGLVIDLSRMRSVTVDPVARIARVEGGATIADVDAATQVYGLAAPLGVVSETGIAGLTLGGGFGWLRNKYGLSADNLLAAEVVTASGDIIHANAENHSALLWALRGGGGNFGIVTQFTYRLHPVGPEVAFAFVFHAAGGDKMARAIRFYRDYTRSAPTEVSTLLSIGVVPPDNHIFPPEQVGIPFVLLAGMHAGPVTAGLEALRPLRELDTPLADFSGAMPYQKAQKILDEDYPRGMRYYWKSLNLSRLDEPVIARLVAHAQAQPSPYSTVDLWDIRGIARHGTPETSAFFGREAAFLVNPEANWVDPADDAVNLTWARGLLADMAAFSDGSRYLNFAGLQEEGDAMIESGFGPHYARLAALKKKYDPANLFRLNQNVKPG